MAIAGFLMQKPAAAKALLGRRSRRFFLFQFLYGFSVSEPCLVVSDHRNPLINHHKSVWIIFIYLSLIHI